MTEVRPGENRINEPPVKRLLKDGLFLCVSIPGRAGGLFLHKNKGLTWQGLINLVFLPLFRLLEARIPLKSSGQQGHFSVNHAYLPMKSRGYDRKCQPIIFIIIIVLIANLGVSLTTPAFAQDLKASWYSEASLIKEGTRKVGERQVMANGQIFNDNLLVCATRLYPLGSLLRITNIENGKSVDVRVGDRIGKRFAETRIDLSKLAFSRISKLEKGIIPIKVEVIK